MRTIAEKTAAAASGEVGAGDLACSRHQPEPTRPRGDLGHHRHQKTARWDRTFPEDRRTTRPVWAFGREPTIFQAEPAPIAIDPIPLFAPKPQSYLMRCSQSAAGIGLAEKFIYGILAGGAVLGVSGGLGWTGELVRHWPTFSAGIDKLLH